MHMPLDGYYHLHFVHAMYHLIVTLQLTTSYIALLSSLYLSTTNQEIYKSL